MSEDDIRQLALKEGFALSDDDIRLLHKEQKQKDTLLSSITSRLDGLADELGHVDADIFDSIVGPSALTEEEKAQLAEKYLEPMTDALNGKRAGFSKREMKRILGGRRLGLSEKEIRQVMASYGANGISLTEGQVQAMAAGSSLGLSRSAIRQLIKEANL